MILVTRELVKACGHLRYSPNCCLKYTGIVSHLWLAKS